MLIELFVLFELLKFKLDSVKLPMPNLTDIVGISEDDDDNDEELNMLARFR
jgi:hypothetical protein